MPPDRPDALRRRLDQVSLRWRRVVVLGLSSGCLGVGYLALLSVHRLIEDGQADWTAPLPVLVGGFVGIAGVVCSARRPIRGVVTRGHLDGALRDGRLPDDADPGLWAPVLRDEHTDLRGRRTAGLAAGTPFVVCTFGLALVVEPSSVGMSLTAGVLVVGGLLLGAAHRRQRQIRRLLEQLPTGVPTAG